MRSDDPSRVRVRGVLAASAAVVGLALSAPVSNPPAHGVDTCAADELSEAEQAKLPYVFTGTVTDVAEAAEDGDVTRIYTVKVDHWWAGEVPERIRVISPATVSECGLRGVREGSPYLFQGREADGGQVRALSNEGTSRVDRRTEQQVTRRMGVRPEKPVSEDADSTQTAAQSPTVLDDSEPPSVIDSVTVPAAVVVGGMLVFGLGAVLGRRQH